MHQHVNDYLWMAELWIVCSHSFLHSMRFFSNPLWGSHCGKCWVHVDEQNRPHLFPHLALPYINLPSLNSLSVSLTLRTLCVSCVHIIYFKQLGTGRVSHNFWLLLPQSSGIPLRRSLLTLCGMNKWMGRHNLPNDKETDKQAAPPSLMSQALVQMAKPWVQPNPRLLLLKDWLHWPKASSWIEVGAWDHRGPLNSLGLMLECVFSFDDEDDHYEH